MVSAVRIRKVERERRVPIGTLPQKRISECLLGVIGQGQIFARVDQVMHLSQMNNLINSGEYLTLAYYTEQTLRDPFLGQSTYGNTAFPLNLTNANGTYHFDFSLSGKMSKVTYPA